MRIEIRNPKSEARKSDQVRLTNSAGTPSSGTGYSSFESGMITFLYIALLAIMMILVMVETSSLIRLRREVKLMEQQQIKRLSASPAKPVQTTTNP